MRVFIAVLVLIFSFQSWTKADDIRDIEIEGMSIGDNALDFFSKNLLDDNTDYYLKSRKFFRTTIKLDKNKNEFSSVQMHVQNENNKYIIYAVAGIIHFERSDPEKKCYNKRSQIVNDISSILTNTKKSDIEEDVEKNDKTGKSVGRAIYFDFKDDFSEYVKVGCVFYGDEFFKQMNWPNHLRLSLTSSELHYWLLNEANG